MALRWLMPLLRGLAGALARLPQRALLALAWVLLWLAWWPLQRRRRIAATNIALCFPELDARARARLLRRNLHATTMGALELVRAWYAPARALRGLAVVEGLERLQEALAAGRGVLLFTGHFTHTELAVRLLSEALGRPVRVVVRRHNNATVEAEFERARTRVYGETIAKKDVRALIRVLRSGEALTYSADQDFNFQHAFVPFFGIPAATLVKTPELVERARAVMLPFWFRREADGRYRLRIDSPWPGWSAAEPEASAAIYMRELERVVREAPEQYLWVHRRFKTRPPGEPGLYP